MATELGEQKDHVVTSEVGGRMYTNKTIILLKKKAYIARNRRESWRKSRLSEDLKIF